MRVFLGMVLGALLTVGGAFFYDTWGPEASAGKTPTAAHRPMVNWNVVEENWRGVRQRTREGWAALVRIVRSP